MTARTYSPIARIVLFLLAPCLFNLPAQARYSGGSGTADAPYQIATAADLIALGETPGDYSGYFVLTADIDLDPKLPGRKIFDKAIIAPRAGNDLLNPPGTDFTGSFDGKGHTIRNLTISGGASGYLGLFGHVGDGGQIRNVCLANVDVTGASGSSCLGSLAGANCEGVIDGCYAVGTVVGGAASREIGGLVGHITREPLRARTPGVVFSRGTTACSRVDWSDGTAVKSPSAMPMWPCSVGKQAQGSAAWWDVM